MDTKRFLIDSIAIGVLVTLLTGLLPVRTLLGATHYGLPTPWLYRLVLGPDQFPWRVDPTSLVVDIAFWVVVVVLVLTAYERLVAEEA